MKYLFKMHTQSRRKGDVVELPNDPNTQSLLQRGIVAIYSPVVETKPDPVALETKAPVEPAPKRRGRPRKVKPDA
jgi:hypothetical protein